MMLIQMGVSLTQHRTIAYFLPATAQSAAGWLIVSSKTAILRQGLWSSTGYTLDPH